MSTLNFERSCNTSNSSQQPTCWWSRRSRLEKWLIVAFFASLLMSVASNLAILFISIFNGHRSSFFLLQEETSASSNNVCLTPGCVKAGKKVEPTKPLPFLLMLTKSKHRIFLAEPLSLVTYTFECTPYTIEWKHFNVWNVF